MALCRSLDRQQVAAMIERLSQPRKPAPTRPYTSKSLRRRAPTTLYKVKPKSPDRMLSSGLQIAPKTSEAVTTEPLRLGITQRTLLMTQPSSSTSPECRSDELPPITSGSRSPRPKGNSLASSGYSGYPHTQQTRTDERDRRAKSPRRLEESSHSCSCTNLHRGVEQSSRRLIRRPPRHRSTARLHCSNSIGNFDNSGNDEEDETDKDKMEQRERIRAWLSDIENAEIPLEPSPIRDIPIQTDTAVHIIYQEPT